MRPEEHPGQLRQFSPSAPHWLGEKPAAQACVVEMMHPVQQLPLLHRPPGHAVRLATLPLSTHTALPVEQSMLPVLHGLVGVQLAPWTQLMQLPALQTAFEPHEEPLAALPTSTQMGLPVEHPMTPVRQRVAGVQVALGVHGLQVPERQAPPGHATPFDFNAPSTHCWLPVEQSVTPSRQAALGFDEQA